MQFQQIIGQHELINKIIHLVQQHHLPHALMIAGHEGSGGLPLALATAQYILCTSKSDSDSCGTCSSCVKMNKLQHPDVHFSFPTYKNDPNKIPVSDHFIREFREFVEANPYGTDMDWLKFLGTDKQGNITATECREIIQKLQLRSFESEYKILIMWYPEYLEKEGNILLKLIEEPTDKTLLFFVTTNLESILPTIQSRTQLFPLKRLSDVEIKDALIQRGISASRAVQYARIAEGNYHYALSLVMELDDDMANILRNWLNCIYTDNGLEIVEWINAMVERNKETQKKFLEYVMQLLEHLIRYKSMGLQNLVLLATEQKMIEVLDAKGMTLYDVSNIIDLLNESIYQIERNASTKILFHSLSLRIQKIVLKKSTLMSG